MLVLATILSKKIGAKDASFLSDMKTNSSTGFGNVASTLIVRGTIGAAGMLISPLCFIFQNQGKTSVLPVLPPVAPLVAILE